MKVRRHLPCLTSIRIDIWSLGLNRHFVSIRLDFVASVLWSLNGMSNSYVPERWTRFNRHLV